VKKFLIVDDHVVVRSGVKALLTNLFNPSEIYEASDGNSAITLLDQHQYDLIIMDIQMPNTDTIGLVDHIHIKFPDAKVLMFSISAEKMYAVRFLKAGAKGFVPKNASLNEITEAINMVLNGRNYISNTLTDEMVRLAVSGVRDNPFEKLSRREFEIVLLLLSGKTLSEISGSLNLQASTVGTHKARLFEKLNITNILELKELAVSYDL
jgi:two-component system, NarL family, invasion response regulator UvrY